MQKYLVLFLFFISPLFSQDYLSICAMFQDEAPYLKEWIDYHHLLGVERFYLYNNCSSDHYQEVLQPYVKTGLVEIIEWPSSSDGNFMPDQEKAYNDCLQRVCDKTFWLGFIDIDEFIVPKFHDLLPNLLVDYEKFGGLQIFWQTFGTSGYYEIPKGHSVMETFIKKAKKNARVNQSYKAIVRPERVLEYKIHSGKYRAPYYAVFPNGAKGTSQPSVQTEIVHLNHYWTRDEKYFREKKIPRRERFEVGVFTEDRIQAILRLYDQEEDHSIFRFLPHLQAKLSSSLSLTSDTEG